MSPEPISAPPQNPDTQAIDTSGADGPRRRSWRPARVEGTDVEAGLRRWNHQLRSRATPAVGRRLAIGLLVCSMAGVAAFSLNLDTDFARQTDANTAQINDLRSALGSVAPPSDSRTMTRSLSGLVDRARSQATLVATGQQRYAELAHQASSRAGTGNGAASPAEMAMITHRRDLAPFWDQSSYVVNGEAAYTYDSADILVEPGMIDPRYPWYIRYDAQTASEAGVYQWALETVTPQSGYQKADVTWVCRETTGDKAVLAWASASFEVANGTFSQLRVTTSAVGALHQPAGTGLARSADLQPLPAAPTAAASSPSSSASGASSPTASPQPSAVRASGNTSTQNGAR